jgi:hypothetical protein
MMDQGFDILPRKVLSVVHNAVSDALKFAVRAKKKADVVKLQIEEKNRRDAERQRFVEWTFSKELDQIECFLDSFDRHLPDADVIEARKLIALLSVANNAPEMEAAFPKFRGHDMHWWVDCSSLAGDPERLLKDLGIYTAVEAWREAEHDWVWRRDVHVGAL